MRGDLPSPANPPKGCSFSTQRPIAIAVCHRIPPSLVEKSAARRLACYVRRHE
ncbi:hypothetical protein [Brucella grignonensis]|uniref:hypothetical protein n=1 Tax=Brucella grignonensis TaxID=94627 RepID=UPI002E25CE44